MVLRRRIRAFLLVWICHFKEGEIKMKSAKALVAAAVAFAVAVVEYLAPALPKEMIVLGGVFLSGLLVYFIPNK